MESIAARRPSFQGASRGLARREFLVLGATGVLTPWVTRLANAAALPVSAGLPQVVAPPAPMSIGFMQGSGELRSLRRLPWETLSAQQLAGEAEAPRFEVTSAKDLPLGDQKLANEVVKVTVHGLYPSARPLKRESLDAIDFEVFFPSPDPAFPKPLPFHAWSYRRLPAPNVGHRLSFNVPLGLDGGLAISLVVGTLGAPQRERYDASFTVDWRDGRPKLQRGIYLLGLGPNVWNSGETLPGPGEKARLDLRSLVISIDDKPKKPRRKKLPVPPAATLR
jgi:hypothetical protein